METIIHERIVALRFRGLIIAAICIAVGYSANCQIAYQNLSVGASFGKGYAVDGSYGRRIRDSSGHDQGWDLIFSLWTPAYRFPLATDNNPQLTDNDVADGAYLEDTKENMIGFGLGVRYVFKPVAIGGMFDLILDNHIDFYHNPVTNTRSQLREDNTLGGWTGSISMYVAERITLNGFYGTRRGINVGLAWNIIDP